MVKKILIILLFLAGMDLTACSGEMIVMKGSDEGGAPLVEETAEEETEGPVSGNVIVMGEDDVYENGEAAGMIVMKGSSGPEVPGESSSSEADTFTSEETGGIPEEEAPLEPEWIGVRSKYFEVLYKSDAIYAKKVLAAADKAFSGIVEEMGAGKYQGFWDFRGYIKIYIDPSGEAYLEMAKECPVSKGKAEKNVIHTYVGEKDFIDKWLPHMIAHFILWDFMGRSKNVQPWLEEGFPLWAARPSRQEANEFVVRQYDRNELILLKHLLLKVNLRAIEDSDKVFYQVTYRKDGGKTTLMLSPRRLKEVYYLESAALIDFLVNSYGKMKFASLCREYTQDAPLENVFGSIYFYEGVQDFNDLEREWRAFLAGKLPNENE